MLLQGAAGAGVGATTVAAIVAGLPALTDCCHSQHFIIALFIIIRLFPSAAATASDYSVKGFSKNYLHFSPVFLANLIKLKSVNFKGYKEFVFRHCLRHNLASCPESAFWGE